MKNKISRRRSFWRRLWSRQRQHWQCPAAMQKRAKRSDRHHGVELLQRRPAESFNRLVSTFNETIGKAKGIRVTGSSQGTVNDLEANVMDAAEGKVGSAEMPTIFAAYADTAYKLDQMGMVVDLKDYLTEDEQAAFVPGYITEGDFDGSGSIKIFRWQNPPS